MKIEYRIGTYVLALLIIILVSIYTIDLLYITRIPAVSPFGFGLIVFFVLLDAGLVICEGKSPQITSNVGHWSVNATKDIFDIPWQTEAGKDELKDLNLLTTRIMLCGGIDYWGISIRSSSEKPVIIAPSIYFHKEEKNYNCYANLERYEIDELPMYLQYIIKRHFSGRIKEKTPIYYSEVSHIDGSATPENMKILLEQREQNKDDSKYQKRLIKAYDEMERGEKSKRKIFVKKELERVEDEESK